MFVLHYLCTFGMVFLFIVLICFVSCDFDVESGIGFHFIDLILITINSINSTNSINSINFITVQLYLYLFTDYFMKDSFK